MGIPFLIILKILLSSLELTIWPGIFSGAFLAFYAFVGFEDMVHVAEEVKNPQRKLPRAILLALATSTVLYVAIAFAVLLVLSPEQLSGSDAPLSIGCGPTRG